jgi:chitosanase
MDFRSLLQQAGSDLVVRDVQDQFFDRSSWIPSVQSAEALTISTSLGTAVVYDSHVQGSWALLRDQTNQRFGLPSEIGAEVWIGYYVSGRKDWLANSSNAALRPTVYRLDAFRQLIDASNWNLHLPISVRGVVIDDQSLSAAALTPVPANERQLHLQAPYLVGDDVKALQQALSATGFEVTADGVFGPQTDAAVRQFQQERGLEVDGVVGPDTRVALGL